MSETGVGKECQTYFLLKSSVIAKFCHAVESTAVDQICLFFLSKTLYVFLGRDSWPRMVPTSKLNWFAE